jgi:hypothetical protein
VQTLDELEARFWSKVRKSDGCWTWTAGKNKWGYGYFWFNGVQSRAHRVAWFFSRGRTEPHGLVCHTCDNPACVRPSHLFVGTQKENREDCRRKGRVPHGEEHGRAVLRAADVLRIRSLNRQGCSQSMIARAFGVSVGLVHRIVHRLVWKHLA